jgi:NAD(P)-dependent dehydrogenase (short-subunit alcohol dehydrogenase family)
MRCSSRTDSVRFSFRVVRWRSGVPRCSSSALSCRLTAGTESRIARAAAERLPASTTRENTVIAANRSALPHLRETRGTIINIGSVVGHTAAPNMSYYGATKAAVESLTRSWALELAPLGVRVNAIAPGPVETAIFR